MAAVALPAPAPAAALGDDAAMDALSALSLASATARTAALPVLAFDALNYLREFLAEPLMRRDPWLAMRALEQRVAQFATAAARGGFRLVAVIDAGTASAEAGAKWRSRREGELRGERRNIVLGADVFLTDALRERGVPVVRPLGADADDVLAALAASVSGGGVLSRDGDFFRYALPPLRVFDGWTLQLASAAGGDVLVPTAAAAGRAVAAASRSARDVQPELATAALAELADAGRASSAIRDKYAAAAKGGCVRRGTTSSSDRRRGSLHVIARPLRAAVYARLGETGAVREILPQWRDSDVSWTDEAVAPDATLDALLDDVSAAAAWLDARDGDDDSNGAPWPQGEAEWRAAERRFNRRVLACELCAAAADPRSADARAGSLLALMRSFPDYAAAPEPSEQERSMAREVTFAGGFDDGPPAFRATCVDCKAGFDISHGEKKFMEEKGFTLPRRCRACRDRRKASGPGR